MAISSNVDVPLASDFFCDRPECPFRSLKWPTVAMAEARGAEHEAEHVSGVPMRELREFELAVDFDGAKAVLDAEILAIELAAVAAANGGVL